MRVVCAALWVGLIASECLAQTTLINPGTLGGNFATAGGVSADGLTVVGTSFNSNSIPRACRWSLSSGLIQDLGDLGGLTSSGVGVNASGTAFACNGQISPQGGPESAYRWTIPQSISPVGDLGTGNAQALGISGDGSTIVGLAPIPGTGTSHAFRWTAASGTQDLGAWGWDDSAAFAVNWDGSVIAGRAMSATSIDREAVRWTNSTGPVRLGTLGGHFSEAFAMDGSGTAIVGRSFTAGNLPTAFLWTAESGMQSLASPPTFESQATAISSNGRVIGGQRTTTTSANQGAFVWTCRSGMQDLRSLVQNRGVNVSGWVLTSVAGISADGSTIVGSGTFNGDRRVFVIRMPPLHCTADFNCSGTISVQDLFDFLRAWFSLGYGADVNGMSGISVQDIFDFLAAWFQGC